MGTALIKRQEEILEPKVEVIPNPESEMPQEQVRFTPDYTNVFIVGTGIILGIGLAKLLSK